MCMVSAIYDYGKSMSPDSWDEAQREAFRKIIQDALNFDKKTGQPDCEDPEKKKWWNAIEEVK